MLGILQEQHPERAKLFAQWKRLNFPMLADPLNLLDVAVVPITLLVDEYGVIRYRNPRGSDFEKFMTEDYAPPKMKRAVLPGSQLNPTDRLVMTSRLREAISAYEKWLAAPRRALPFLSGRVHFRLGVAYRMAYDTDQRPEDFAKAVEHWRKARAVNGGQYIWRRRIQQYGPQPDKPYPFYDWVAVAQTEITKRGEKPVALKVPLSVSEKMGKVKWVRENGLMVKPMTDGLVEDQGSVAIQPVVLPTTGGKGDVFRVHLLLKPAKGGKYLWNNEAGPVKIWLDVPEDVQVNSQGMEIAVDVSQPTSEETRSVEFEWRVKKEKTLKGYAVYHVCDKENGQCSVLMQKFTVSP